MWSDVIYSASKLPSWGVVRLLQLDCHCCHLTILLILLVLIVVLVPSDPSAAHVFHEDALYLSFLLLKASQANATNTGEDRQEARLH